MTTETITSGDQSTLVNGNAASVPRMSFDEFMQRADEDTRAEWVDGEVILLSPVTRRHQLLSKLLAAALTAWTEDREIGEVLDAPFRMRLATRPSGREPDVLFVRRERFHLFRNAFLDGPADLVIEVISPESRERDTRIKLQEYEVAGVPEYWVLDPLDDEHRFYQLEAGRYRRVDFDDDGIYRSKVLEGLWLRKSWLNNRPLPKLVDVLREWEII